MSCPRVFVSSTYYDLKHVREMIRDFIQGLGYEPVLSEDSDILYKPGDSVQNSCLLEIPSCDLFVLIIGKRYGSRFPEDTLSITHREYSTAHNHGIPIYAFVDLDVLHDFEFHEKNKPDVALKYRVIEDNAEVFKLISEVRNAARDNALVPFSSISEILDHLRKQWAHLLKNLLPQPSAAQEEPMDESFEKYREEMQQFGFEDLTQGDVTNADSFLDLVKRKGGQVLDHETSYRINVHGRVSHVGKVVMRILDQ